MMSSQRRQDQRHSEGQSGATAGSGGELPREAQQLIFERAVVAGHHAEEDFREQLAEFLHDKHPRHRRYYIKGLVRALIAGGTRRFPQDNAGCGRSSIVMPLPYATAS